jgi:hypothetical protein
MTIRNFVLCAALLLLVAVFSVPAEGAPGPRLDEAAFRPKPAEVVEPMKAKRWSEAVGRADEIDRAHHRPCRRPPGLLRPQSARDATGSLWCEAIHMKACALVEP